MLKLIYRTYRPSHTTSWKVFLSLSQVYWYFTITPRSIFLLIDRDMRVCWKILLVGNIWSFHSSIYFVIAQDNEGWNDKMFVFHSPAERYSITPLCSSRTDNNWYFYINIGPRPFISHVIDSRSRNPSAEIYVARYVDFFYL